MDALHSIFSEYPSAGAVRCREGNCGGDCVESCVGACVEVVGDGYCVTSSPRQSHSASPLLGFSGFRKGNIVLSELKTLGTKYHHLSLDNVRKMRKDK